MIRGRIQGSFTVEAALIMPIIIYLIFSFFYLTFYLHDCNRIQGYLDKVLNRAALIIKHESDISKGEIKYEEINNRGVFYLIIGKKDKLEEDIYRYIEDEFSEGLLMMRVTDIDVEVGKYSLEVKITAETKNAMRGVLRFFQPNEKKIIEGKQIIHNPADTIRMSEVILDTGSRIKGVEELKGIIENILK